nr:PREDICTED: breast cancer type 1 susceptibility protein homolog isoform X2 [Linepithema humile]
MASQNDREEQRTPKRRKLNDRDENAAAEGRHAEEDDIVENTPERTRKSSESNIKTVESRKSTSRLSTITITSGSSILTMPLYESTPKIARPTVSGQSRKLYSKQETIVIGSNLLPKQTDGKTSENVLSDRQQLCFLCTSLSKVQVSLVKKLAAKHSANYVNQFDRNVTHVIVNTTGKRNVAKSSTLKYLQGIAHRKWIVIYRWVEDCIMQEKLLNEVPYEATTSPSSFNDGVIGVKGPRNSRLREKDLFEGFTFLCIKPYHNVSLSQYQDLLLATGATVVDSLEDLAKKGGMKGVVIQYNTHDTEMIERWYYTAKAAPIFVEWIVECIGQYKLLKLASQYLSVEDFQAIGYPRELVEEYEEYSDVELI